MKAEVKAVFSSDFDERSHSEEGDEFSFWIQVLVGPEGEGEDSHEQFQVQVCTPKWLLKFHQSEDIIVGTGRIIVLEYDWPRLERTIRDWVSSWSAPTWRELALKIARLGPWEFDHP